MFERNEATGIRPIPFGGEREIPGRKPVQIREPSMTQAEIDAYLLAIDAKTEGRDG